jgi:hypothetical protein
MHPRSCHASTPRPQAAEPLPEGDGLDLGRPDGAEDEAAPPAPAADAEGRPLSPEASAAPLPEYSEDQQAAVMRIQAAGRGYLARKQVGRGPGVGCRVALRGVGRGGALTSHVPSRAMMTCHVPSRAGGSTPGTPARCPAVVAARDRLTRTAPIRLDSMVLAEALALCGCAAAPQVREMRANPRLGEVLTSRGGEGQGEVLALPDQRSEAQSPHSAGERANGSRVRGLKGSKGI